MSNVAHSTLTGSNLHENKGVAAATDNTVATASSGSTVWKKLDSTNIGPTGNPFGAGLLHVRNEQTSGTVGDTLSPGSWSTRVLNTVKTNEISGASLSGNQITLPIGTYFIDAAATTYLQEPGSGAFDNAVSKLYNVTDAADTVIGMPTVILQNSSTTRTNSVSIVRQRFTIAGTKVFELRTKSLRSATGGNPCSAGVVEVYSDVLIWKTA